MDQQEQKKKRAKLAKWAVIFIYGFGIGLAGAHGFVVILGLVALICLLAMPEIIGGAGTILLGFGAGLSFALIQARGGWTLCLISGVVFWLVITVVSELIRQYGKSLRKQKVT